MISQLHWGSFISLQYFADERHCFKDKASVVADSMEESPQQSFLSLRTPTDKKYSARHRAKSIIFTMEILLNSFEFKTAL